MRTPDKNLKNDPNSRIQFSPELIKETRQCLVPHERVSLQRTANAQQAVIKNLIPQGVCHITSIEHVALHIYDGRQLAHVDLKGFPPNIDVVLAYTKQFSRGFITLKPKLGVDNEVKRVAVSINHRGDIDAILVLTRDEENGQKNNAVKVTFDNGILKDVSLVRVTGLVDELYPEHDSLRAKSSQANTQAVFKDLQGVTQEDLWNRLTEYVAAFQPT